jgi:putative peptidoglycan lipid II flippase
VGVGALLVPAAVAGGYFSLGGPLVDSDWSRVLFLLGIASSVGMAVAGFGLLVAVRRRLGREAIRGLVTTVVVAVIAFSVAAYAGGLAAGTQRITGLSLVGRWTGEPLTLTGALIHGVIAAAVAVAVVVPFSLVDPAIRRRLTSLIRRRIQR